MKDKNVVNEVAEVEKLQAEIYAGIVKLHKAMPTRKMFLQAFINEIDEAIEQLEAKVEKAIAIMESFIEDYDSKKENDNDD